MLLLSQFFYCPSKLKKIKKGREVGQWGAYAWTMGGSGGSSGDATAARGGTRGLRLRGTIAWWLPLRKLGGDGDGDWVLPCFLVVCGGD